MAALRNHRGEPFLAVCFDVDGTLYRKSLRLLLRLLRVRGGARTLKVVAQAREQLRGQTFESRQLLDAQLLAQVGAVAGVDPDGAALILQQHRQLVPQVIAGAGSTDARAALRVLHHARIPMAVLSDHDATRKIAALGLDVAVFRCIVSCDDVAAYKPHPRGFERVLADLGLAPDRVLHVGDRSDTDAAGALATGMGAALLKPARAPAGVVSIRTLSQLAWGVLQGHGR
jgi:HAD superfamily hydrolase (TIGR01549 family)